MTDTFREIERGHEAMFKLDEELRFKARSRRNKLFGLWAAQRMGMPEADADAYARGLVLLGIDSADGEAVVGKVVGDFRDVDVGVEEAEARGVLQGYYAEALKQLANVFPTALGNDHVQVGG